MLHYFHQGIGERIPPTIIFTSSQSTIVVGRQYIRIITATPWYTIVTMWVFILPWQQRHAVGRHDSTGFKYAESEGRQGATGCVVRSWSRLQVSRIYWKIISLNARSLEKNDEKNISVSGLQRKNEKGEFQNVGNRILRHITIILSPLRMDYYIYYYNSILISSYVLLQVI